MLKTLRRTALAAALCIPLAGCGDDAPTQPVSLAGTYRATVFRILPTGRAPIDAIAQGGTLTITINADRSTSGTLSLPASVAGGTPLTESMAGTAVQTGSSVQFQQTADTVVRDLTWSLGENGLTAVDQVAGGARFTITLTRQ